MTMWKLQILLAIKVIESNFSKEMKEKLLKELCLPQETYTVTKKPRIVVHELLPCTCGLRYIASHEGQHNAMCPRSPYYKGDASGGAGGSKKV